MTATAIAPQVALLTALQFGDSLFPAGASSFSWGLETLCAEGHIRRCRDDVGRFLSDQLLHRWAPFDRPALVAARDAAMQDLDALNEVDAFIESATLAREMREGSARLGTALLRIHSQLGCEPATRYLARVGARRAPGQLTAVQGLVAQAHGFDVDTACALSAYGFCSTLTGAALRLGLIGHIDAQDLLQQARPTIIHLLTLPVPALADTQSYAPAAEIAMMRHETGLGRLFAN